ncbi:tetratricopeptide repeat protein [Hyphobacterium marinum]|uniref:Tetratricopeptide repeat protein n=1 Tax=Hyphobacterium marinum TaxID=3116574 RepID=A0ABU7LUL3_9PROT|nr:tetratricopeptide repeat protein [Hyphobacterium sp. Y6023]MEE2565248.1 tetratricopeptide repeat protein [Hyphobacterium sp. Y6023]
MRVFLFVAGLGLIASAAEAQTSSYEAVERARYEACLQRVETDPENAYEDALAWKYDGGGWPALHCEARALVTLGEEEEGARRMEAMGMASDGGTDAMRVLVLAEAGEAFLLANAPEEARRAYTNALSFNENSAPLWMGRARAALVQEMWTAAEADATAAISHNAGLAEAWRTRAEARLELGRLDGAESDMNRARELDPADIETLVIRGRILEARRLGG